MTPGEETGTIPLQEYAALLRSGVEPLLLDVRTPGEFARVHAAGARSLPLDKLSGADMEALAAECKTADGHIYIICHSGTRAMQAREQLARAGVQGTCCIEGGTAAWEAAGLPVVRGPGGVISLERQVRLGAGILVLAGYLLGRTVHPGFYLLSAFTGCGLIFAGATDLCGMAILLGKMPWNR